MSLMQAASRMFKDEYQFMLFVQENKEKAIRYYKAIGKPIPSKYL